MTKDANFWPNLALLGPKILIFKGGSKTFNTLISRNLLDTCFVLKILTGEALMGRFWQKRDQKSIFCFRIADFLSKGHITITPGATPKKFSTRKKIPFPRYGTAVFAFCRKAEKGPKICFLKEKKHPKPAKRLIFIWEKGSQEPRPTCWWKSGGDPV